MSPPRCGSTKMWLMIAAVAVLAVHLFSDSLRNIEANTLQFSPDSASIVNPATIKRPKPIPNVRPPTAPVNSGMETERDPNSYLQPDLAFAEYDADEFWENLVRSELVEGREGRWVIEAGSFDGKQLRGALERNFSVMVFEPSKLNFERVTARIRKICQRQEACKGRLKRYQKAASSKRSVVHFKTTDKGGTGDHITLNGRAAQGEYLDLFTRQDVVQAVPLDDYIVPESRNGSSIFALKIDVQDHEPAVIQGLNSTITKSLADFIILEYRPQGWAHMFPDTKPELELLRVCGQGAYRCFYSSRMTRAAFRPGSKYPRFFPGWASLGPDGNGWPIAKFNQKMMQLKQPEEFGTWTDIVALNTKSELAVAVFDELLTRKCNTTVYSLSQTQCRPKG